MGVATADLSQGPNADDPTGAVLEHGQPDVVGTDPGERQVAGA